jgi:hypothetical protein
MVCSASIRTQYVRSLGGTIGVGPFEPRLCDERGPALVALAVLAGEFRGSGREAVAALFDAIAGAITRDASTDDTLH